MGMRTYACSDYEIDRDYARTFKEFVSFESYINNLDGVGRGPGMSDVAYLLENGDDIWGEMDSDQKQHIKDLWDSFVEAFTKMHASASIYLQYVGNDCEGPDRPDDGWYIGVMNRMVKNPALEDLDNAIKEISWVTWG